MDPFATPPPPREARVARLLDDAQAKISRRDRTIREMRETNAYLRDELAQTHEANAALQVQLAEKDETLADYKTVDSIVDRDASITNRSFSVTPPEIDREVLSKFEGYAAQLREAKADGNTFIGTTIAIGREVCEIAPSVSDNIDELLLALRMRVQRLVHVDELYTELSKELGDHREATKSALHELGEEKAAHARVVEELRELSIAAESRIEPDEVRYLHGRYVMVHQRLERFGSSISSSIDEVKTMDQAFIDFTSLARGRRGEGERSSSDATVLGKTAQDMSETLDEQSVALQKLKWITGDLEMLCEKCSEAET